MSLPDHSLIEMAAALRRGDFSSRELTLAHLERIDRLEPALNGFITRTPELALAQADAADRRRASAHGAALPELLGIPLAIKDVLCVEGVRTTCGSRMLENFIPPYSATAVERLLQDGMVLLGKANTDEFAMGSSTENSAYGVSRNPWDLQRTPGGSSGGSAALTAARMAPAALGTDTGGSVRQPAAFCGLTGLKPTYGRVSRFGLVAFGSSLDTVGVLARSAADVAAVFVRIAGPDPRDATCADRPTAPVDLEAARPETFFDGLRIGVPDEYFRAAAGAETGVHPEVEAAVRSAIRRMETMGARIEAVSLPHTEYALPVYYLIAPAEASANLARYDGVRYGARSPNADTLWDVFYQTRGENFGPEVKRRIMLGTFALSAGYYDAYYGQAQKVRTLIRRDFEEVFKHVDLIAAPVTPGTAFTFGEHRDDLLALYLEDIYTLPANLAGIPAAAFPVGFDPLGLPIGMQLMGPRFAEQQLLQAAHTYQQVTDWHTRRPAFD